MGKYFVTVADNTGRLHYLNVDHIVEVCQGTRGDGGGEFYFIGLDCLDQNGVAESINIDRKAYENVTKELAKLSAGIGGDKNG